MRKRLFGWNRRVPNESRRARRAGAAHRPDVDALEGRQLLTSYKLLTFGSFTTNLIPSGETVVMDARGDLFGTTGNGGTAGDGTLFELPKGAHRARTLASFTSATGDDAGTLVIDSRGDIFGTTQNAGANGTGTLFELARGSRRITVLASFPVDYASAAKTSLVRDSQGNLYGINGGSSPLIYELPARSHTISTLYTFPFNEVLGGVYPDNGLAVDAQGDLFGTDSLGLFELSRGAGTTTTLATISSAPATGIALGNNGTLYCVVPNFVYSYVPGSGAGTVTTLASFNNPDAIPDSAPVVDARGDVFGTLRFVPPYPGATFPGGATSAVYEVAAGSSTVKTLATFTGTTLDPVQSSILSEDSRGDLFGLESASTGGTALRSTVFELAVVPTPRARR